MFMYELCVVVKECGGLGWGKGSAPVRAQCYYRRGVVKPVLVTITECIHLFFQQQERVFSSQDIQVQVKSQVTDVKVQVKFQVSLIFVQIHQMYHSSQSHVSRVKTSRLLSCHCRHWSWFQLGEICLDEETSCGHFQLCSVDRYMAPPSSVLILFFLGCYTPPVGVNKSKNQPVWPCR